jgi:hypothetical protein
MFSKVIAVVLVAVLVHGSIAAQDQPQSPQQTVAKMQQVLHKAQEKDKAVKVILNKKIEPPHPCLVPTLTLADGLRMSRL